MTNNLSPFIILFRMQISKCDTSNAHTLLRTCHHAFFRSLDNYNASDYDKNIFIHTLINSSSPSAAYMRQWIGSAFVQIMARRLFGAEPLSAPVLGYC